MPDEPTALQDPKDVLPVRDPRDAVDNYMTIYDERGLAHRKPKIVAKECLRIGNWTKDLKVAGARRAGQDPAPKRPTGPSATELDLRAQELHARELKIQEREAALGHDQEAEVVVSKSRSKPASRAPAKKG